MKILRHLFPFAALLAVGGCGVIDMPGLSQLRPAQPATDASISSVPMSSTQEASLFLNVVRGLVKQERYDAALAFLDDYALKQKALEPRYWLLRGDALLGVGRGAEAALAYANLDSSPLAAEGWNGRGRVEAARSRWSAANADFRKAIQLRPANVEFLNNVAFCELQLGRSAESVRYLQQARQLEPNSELVRNNLIIALTVLGDNSGAQGLLSQIDDPQRRNQVQDLARKARNGEETGKGSAS